MNLYLTQLLLHTPSAAREMQHDPGLHRFVLSLFPKSDASARSMREQAHVLHLVSPSGSDTTKVLVQSSLAPKLPDESRLVRSFSVKDISASLDRIHDGMQLRYSLTAAPIKAKLTDAHGTPHTASSGRPRGKRVALVGEEERKQWLERKLADAAVIESVTAEELSRIFSKRKPMYTPVRYQGVLTVSDADRLRDVVAHGIGRGRPYGLGLLLLA